MFSYIINQYNMHPRWVLEGSKKPKGLLVRDIAFDAAPHLQLPETIDDFYGMHKRKFWYNINRAERLFVNKFGQLDFIVVSDKAALLQYLPKIQELFAVRWAKSYTSLDWKTKNGFKKYQEAMLDLASTGNGELAVLVNNRNVLSFGYSLFYGSNYYFFQHAVDPDPRYRQYSLGKIFIKKLIESTIQRGFEWFDFMTGDQDYKREWATGSKKVFIRVAEEKSIPGYLRFLLKGTIYKGQSFIHANKRLEGWLKKVICLLYR
jgi:CelD/BcsL family acetyltransferase involved in cellulose biosynthesis